MVFLRGTCHIGMGSYKLLYLTERWIPLVLNFRFEHLSHEGDLSMYIKENDVRMKALVTDLNNVVGKVVLGKP